MKVFRNYIYNVSYQLLVILLPIITVPYVSRVLGVTGVGNYAYCYSVIQYFMLLGTLGMTNYATRQVAYSRDNKEKLAETFWTLFITQVLTVLVAVILFILFISIQHQNTLLFIAQVPFLISAALDISWLFMGLEDFKKIVIRNSLVKLIGIVLIFIFVKQKSDLVLYAWILSGTQLLSLITLWPFVPKIINNFSFKLKIVKKNLLPMIAMFIPQVAIQVYVILSKIMLGIMTSPTEVGYFDSADKIVRIILTLVTAIGTVMFPRMSSEFAKGNLNSIKSSFYKTMNLVTYISIPMSFGLSAISGSLVSWFFGKGFYETGPVMAVSAGIIFFISWGVIIGNQYLLPTNRVREYTKSVFAGAILNIILNLVLIPEFKAVGTAIASLIAEGTVTGFMLFYTKKKYALFPLIREFMICFCSSLAMFLVLKFIERMLTFGGIRLTFIQVLVGIVFYIVCTFLGKSKSLIFILKIISKIRFSSMRRGR